MHSSKYLIAYLGPLSAFAGLYFGGAWSFGFVYLAFGILPLLELFLPTNRDNFQEKVENEKTTRRYFDFLLYTHVPILYGILFYAFYKFAFTSLTTLEVIGLIFNIGVMVGSFGINIGHELGHRGTRYEQFFAKALLLPALYQHFFIEHNRGHHKNVATDVDPASARLSETVYAFWWRSVSEGYKSAWHIEQGQLQRDGYATLSRHNMMLRFQIYQSLYLIVIGLFFSITTILIAIAIAIVGFLLLETVNYIEHYGLRRALLPNGRYEPVLPKHSWNSDHALGRIFLYELTRHSDHHFKATRKYQVLRHFDDSPQLPFGYPMSMLIALVPPLWFNIMRPRAVETKLEVQGIVKIF